MRPRIVLTNLSAYAGNVPQNTFHEVKVNAACKHSSMRDVKRKREGAGALLHAAFVALHCIAWLRVKVGAMHP